MIQSVIAAAIMRFAWLRAGPPGARARARFGIVSVDEDFLEWDDFSIAAAAAGSPVTRRLHVGFVAPSREHVDAFWRAGNNVEMVDHRR